MAGLNSIDDSNWAEVKHINCYAMFMGYLWMAMRGLGLLVVTWTTVVLLGGFVSMLNKKDFWCLTVITLVQTAGVFNIHPTENLAAIPRLCLNFLRTMNITITWEGAQARTKEGPICRRLLEPSGLLCVGARKLVAFGVALIQAMVLSIILCPVAALYGFGLYITTVLALWRLIEHDYGTSGGETTNMDPAISVLYVLAVLQGAVFCYRGLLRFAGKKIANQVAQGYKFEQGADSPVLGYLDESRVGCEKDPSFARGRNLITYALDLMESDSPDDLLSGTSILDTLITYDERKRSFGDSQDCRRIPMVMERLLGPSSSGKIFRKLLKALDSRSPCDRETTKRASRIVLSLAGGIRTKQFPEGIGCISSLLDASRWEAHDYKQLMLDGLLIIQKIVSHEDNCILMSTSHINSLLFKVVKPLSSNTLHRVSHDACADLVDASLQLLCTWLNTVNRIGHKKGLALPKESISAMETIVTCDRCPKERRILAMKVLVTQLNIQDKENIIVQLLGIFLGYTKDEYITGLAGEKLVMLSLESKSNAKIILEDSGSVERILVLLGIEGKIKKCSVGILAGLCKHYIPSHLGKNDPCFENLKRLIIGSMPELLIETLPSQWERSRNVSPDNVDIESQNNVIVSLYNPEHNEDKRSQAACLLYLCLIVYQNMLNEEDDLPLLLEAVCSKDAQFNLPGRLIEMVERNSDPTVVDCLKILKSAAMMAKSMMRHKRIYPTEDLARLMDSLTTVCTRMRHLDAFELLSGTDCGMSLFSLVRQANGLFRSKKKDLQLEVSSKGKESEITEPSGPSTTFEKEAQTPEDMKLTEPEITELSAPSTIERGQSSSS